MKISDITADLLGKRVSCTALGLNNVKATVTGVVFYGADGSGNPDRLAVSDPEELKGILEKGITPDRYCSCGLRVTYDEPIMWGADIYTEGGCGARVSDGWGNLNHVCLI